MPEPAGPGADVRRGALALRWMLWAAGAALLAAAAALAWRALVTTAPYRYELAPPAAAASAADGVRQVKLIGEDGKVLAEADIAPGAAGPVLLQWHARVDDPLLYLSVATAETQALAAVLARHRKPGTVVLAWWDTSRQLEHWGAGEMRFDQHLAKPLFVPQRWRGQMRQVKRIEDEFWHIPADTDQGAAFETFARALVSPEDEGIALLRELAPGSSAVVVLHLRDLILLGQMFPQQIAVAFQDFADSGDVHRSVRGVQGWLRETDQAAYGVVKQPDNMLRAIAVKGEASASTLAARLLPLIGNRQDDVPGMTLVYRTASFVVFELSPAKPPPAAPAQVR